MGGPKGDKDDIGWPGSKGRTGRPGLRGKPGAAGLPGPEGHKSLVFIIIVTPSLTSSVPLDRCLFHQEKWTQMDSSLEPF